MHFQCKPFQELTITELYAILQVRTDVFVVEQACPYPEVDGKDQQCLHMFLEIEGDIAAYCRLLPPGISYEQTSIGRVLVHPAHRGKGLAQQMMKLAINTIEKEMNETTIKIQAQAYLQAFYEQLGFLVVSDTYLEDNIPHIDMVRTV